MAVFIRLSESSTNNPVCINADHIRTVVDQAAGTPWRETLEMYENSKVLREENERRQH